MGSTGANKITGRSENLTDNNKRDLLRGYSNEALQSALSSLTGSSAQEINDRFLVNEEIARREQEGQANGKGKSSSFGVLNKLTEPSKFSSSTVDYDMGKDYGVVELRIYNNGSSGFNATLNLPGGGRYEKTGLTSFSAAKKAFPSLIERYVDYKNRFKGRKLSAKEWADLTNGL